MGNSQRGFTLLEVLIALLLIGIASLALIKLQIYTEQRSDFAVRSIEGLNLIENKLEWFRTRGADSNQSSVAVADFDLISSGSDSLHSYQLVWQISTPSAELSSSLKQITITAQWQDRLGEPHQLTLNTMIARDGEFISR